MLYKKFYNITFFYSVLSGYEDTKNLIEKASSTVSPYGFHYYEAGDFYFLHVDSLIKQLEKKYNVDFPMKYDLKRKDIHEWLYHDHHYVNLDNSGYEYYQLFELIKLYELNIEMVKNFILLLNDREECLDIYFKRSKEYSLTNFIDSCVHFLRSSSDSIFDYRYLDRNNPVYELGYINGEISLEEIYYIIKYLILSDDEFELSWSEVDNIYNKCNDKKLDCPPYYNFLIRIKQKMIENNYDSRILVVPKV